MTDEEKAQIDAIGGWQKLMETLKQRLAEQKERHQGGSKWIGTAGTSPFGAYGYNPEGAHWSVRFQEPQCSQGMGSARVRDYDGNVELGLRNIKVALRRLRKFARDGAADELDLHGTIRATANNAGYLDLQLVPERHNRVKVLLFLDVGGSMDDYVHRCEKLFSTCKTEFKRLEYFYFHNFIYEGVWRN